MRKIITIFLLSIIFYGCGPGLYIKNNFEFLENRVLNLNNNKETVNNIYIFLQPNDNYYLFGFFPFIIKSNQKNFGLFIKNINNSKSIKVNSYIIKINGKKKIEKKKVKVKNIETKKENIIFYFKDFKSYKNKDIIEIIFDISILKDGAWDNAIISRKFIGHKTKKVAFLWD